MDTDIRIGVANGICEVTTSRDEVIDAGFGRVDKELKNLANETVDRYSGEAGEKVTKRLDRTMAAVPSGLPVLPPNWIFTVNIWTYEIVGKYQSFTVIDNDNEVIPKPYFGHKGQKYVREKTPIYHPFKKDENGVALTLGTNEMIASYFSGYATTVVGPGPKGVGDKIEGSDEISEDYESILEELGGKRQ